MFTTTKVACSNMGAGLGHPYPPAGQGSAAAAAFEYNAQIMMLATSALITGLQTHLRVNTGCLSTAGIMLFALVYSIYAAKLVPTDQHGGNTLCSYTFSNMCAFGEVTPGAKAKALKILFVS